MNCLSNPPRRSTLKKAASWNLARVHLILASLIAFSSAQLFAQKRVDYRALNKDVVIIGKLGVPLGTAVEIEAKVLSGKTLHSELVGGKYFLVVSKVGRKPLAEPPICLFELLPWASVEIASDTSELYEMKRGKKASKLTGEERADLERDYVGRTYHLLVYEEGFFSGIPKGLPSEYQVWHSHNFNFDTKL